MHGSVKMCSYRAVYMGRVLGEGGQQMRLNEIPGLAEQDLGLYLPQKTMLLF